MVHVLLPRAADWFRGGLANVLSINLAEITTDLTAHYYTEVTPQSEQRVDTSVH